MTSRQDKPDPTTPTGAFPGGSRRPARRRLNKPLVATLTAAACLGALALSVAIIMRLRPQDPAPFVKLAEQAVARKDHRRAIALYSRAAGISHDARYLARAGDLWLLEGNLPMARATWEAGKTMDPRAAEPRQRTLSFLIEFAKLANTADAWQSVLREADGLLAVDADDALGHYARGLALYQDPSRDGARDDAAIEALRQAVTLDPLNVEYTLELAAALELGGRGAEALEALTSLSSRLSQPSFDATRIRCAWGAFLGRAGQLDEAGRLFDEAMALAAGDGRARALAFLQRARLHLSRAAQIADTAAPQARVEFEAAQKDLEEAIAQDPQGDDAVAELSRLSARLGRFDDAQRVCQERIARGFPNVGLDAFRRQAQIYELTILAADAATQGARQKDLPPADRDRRLAQALQWVQQAQKEWAQGPRGLALEGEILLLQGKERDALDRLTRADQGFAERKRIDWRVKTLLARLHLGFNESGAALALLDKVRQEAERQRPDDAALWSTYADALIRNDRAADALTLADRALALRADDATALRVKVEALTRLGRAAEVQRIVGALDATGASGVLLKSRLLAAQGEDAQAFDLLAEHLAASPGQPAVLREAVGLATRAGKEDEARRLVQEARQREPANPELDRLSIILDPSLGAAAREEALLKLIEADPDPLSRALRHIGLYAFKQDHARVLQAVAEAEAALERSTAERSEAARRQTLRLLTRHKLFAAAQLKDWAAAEQAVQRATELDLDGVGGKLFRGELHLHRGEFEPAAAVLREVVAAQPTNAFALTLLGACCMDSGRLSDAASCFQRAVDANPNYAAAQRGLAVVAYANGDEDTYNRALTQCQRLLPRDPWVARHLQLRADEQEPEQALQRRRRQLEQQGDDVENLLQAARLCQRLRRIEEADDFFARALKLAPGSQEVVFKAADHFRGTQRWAQAENAVRAYIDLQEKPAARANAMLTLAALYLRSGRLEDEEKILLEAAATQETFEVCLSVADYYLVQREQPGLAASWYEKAMALSDADQHPRWLEALIRRITCALHAGVNDLEGAAALIEKGRARAPDMPEWLYWSAQVAGASGRPEEAIQRLDQYLQARPQDVAGRFARAQQSAAQGLWAAAIEDLELIKARQPAALDLRPRLLLAGCYENARRPDAALRELESLAEEFPNSPHAAQELLAAYVRAGRPADAERVATAQLNRYTDARALLWLKIRAELARRSGQHAKALDDDLRAAELTDHAPDEVGRVLQDFQRLGRFNDGVKYFETYVDDAAAPSTLRALCAQLLAGGQHIEAAAGQFARAMDSALQEGFGSVLRVGRAAAQTHPGQELRDRFFEALRGVSPSPRVLVLFESAFDEVAGAPDSAADRLSRLIEAEPPGALRTTLLRAHAMICHIHGDADPAIRSYQAVIEAEPDDAVSLNNLASLMLTSRHDPRKAEEFARRAVLAAKDDALRAETNDTLAWILVQQGRAAEAILGLNLAIRLMPDKAVFHHHLGEAYRRCGRFELAQRISSAALEWAQRSGETELATQIRESLEKTGKRDAGA